MAGQADIFELMLADHRRIDRLQAALHDTAGPARLPVPRLASVWDRLAGLIADHVLVARQVCWLVICGPGPQGQEQLPELAADADDIVDAIATARLQPVGSACWWTAVSGALRCCDTLLRREEHLLAAFAARASRAQRDQLGRQWLGCLNARPSKRGYEHPVRLTRRQQRVGRLVQG